MAATIIKTGMSFDSSKYREIMVDSEADLADIDLREVAPGSVAYTCKEGSEALDELWMLNQAKTAWVPM